MKSSMFRATARSLAVAAVGAIGFAATASVAFAQGDPGGKSGSSVAAPTPGTVPGVVVEPGPKLHNRIPPHKRAAFDAEAAHRKAWSQYRGTVAAAPPPKGPGSGPQTENYPGLSNLSQH
jgi:hypothetical protein